MRPFKGGLSRSIAEPTARAAGMRIEEAISDLSDSVGRIQRGQTPTSGGGGGVIGVTDHGALTGLGDDDHSQYLLLAGRAGGQTVYGGTAGTDKLALFGSSNDLTLANGALNSWITLHNRMGIRTQHATAGNVTYFMEFAGGHLFSGITQLGGDEQSTYRFGYYGNSDTLSGGYLEINVGVDGAFGNLLPEIHSTGSGITLHPSFGRSIGGLSVGVLTTTSGSTMTSIASTGQLGGQSATVPMWAIISNVDYPVAAYPAIQLFDTGRIRLKNSAVFPNDFLQCLSPSNTTLASIDNSGNITAPTITATTAFVGTLPAHNLLSGTHGDTLTGTVVRGDLVIGNSTPKWGQLAIGTSGKYLRTNGTDPSWAVVSESDVAVETPSVLARVQRNETIDGNWYYSNGNGGRALGVLSSGGLGNDDGHGFAITDGTYWAKIGIDSSTVTSDVELTLPAASARLVGSSETVTLTNKRLGAGTKLQCGTTLADSTQGTFFSRGTSTTVGIRVNLAASTTNIKDWTALNFFGTVPLVGDVTSAASGKLVKVDSGTKTADIASTALTSTPGAGMYVIHWTLETVATDVTAGTVSATFAWTGGSAWTTTVGGLLLTTSGHAEGSFPVTVVSGDINYSTSHTGIFGTSSYKLTVRVVALG